ncbi:MAG: flavin reductase [Actinobacteria bacterium]|nr:MAG: flavin reductase [Actinomycetota bacterium]
MQKVLVIHGHPDEKSFTSACAEAYSQSAEKAGHEVRNIDLASARFDPVLRFGYRQRMEEEPFIQQSQEDILWAQHIAVFFPTWWAGEPSVLKGWFDRVLTPGIAYRYIPGKVRPERLLSGRTATLVTSSHAPAWYTRWTPAYPVRRVGHLVLGYCGVRVVERHIYGLVGSTRDTRESRENFIHRCERSAAHL